MDGQVLLLLVIVETQMLTPSLRRENTVLKRDAIDVGFLQLVADLQCRRNDLDFHGVVHVRR